MICFLWLVSGIDAPPVSPRWSTGFAFRREIRGPRSMPKVSAEKPIEIARALPVVAGASEDEAGVTAQRLPPAGCLCSLQSHPAAARHRPAQGSTGVPFRGEIKLSQERDRRTNGVPTAANPLGVKGAGQAGAIAAPQTIITAVLDALAPLGVTHIDMPATPDRVWQAIRQAGNAS